MNPTTPEGWLKPKIVQGHAQPVKNVFYKELVRNGSSTDPQGSPRDRQFTLLFIIRSCTCITGLIKVFKLIAAP